MKNIIYGAVVAILVLSSIAVLLLYYTQPFTADFNFKKSIAFSDLKFNNVNNYQGVYVLDFAEADLGKLNLVNKGYFTQSYKIPQLIGCVDFSSSVKDSDSLRRYNSFDVLYNVEGSSYYSGQEVQIPIGVEKEIKVSARYSAYDIPADEFTKGKITSVSIYSFEKKERNPLTQYNYDNYQGKQCDDLKLNSEPLAVIKIE